MSTNYPITQIPNLYERDRRLRKEMTSAESILWKHLRNRRFAGFKFRRQHRYAVSWPKCAMEPIL